MEHLFWDTQLIKKAALSGFFIHRRPEEVLLEFISLYWEYYQSSDDIDFLNFSSLHLRAYLEAGYDYRPHTALFTEIVKEEGHPALSDLLREIHYKKRTLRLTKNSLRNILGRGKITTNYGNFSTKESLIGDIFYRIQHQISGTYCYCSHYYQIYTLTFLIIEKEEVYLYDNKGTVYAVDREIFQKSM